MLTTTFQIVSTFGRERHWSAGQLHEVAVIERGLNMIVIAYFAVTALLQIRSHLRGRSEDSSAS